MRPFLSAVHIFKERLRFRVPRRAIRGLTSFCFRVEELPAGKWEVAFVFVGDQEIRRLNRLFRKCDRITDVLAFRTPHSGKGFTPQWWGDIFINLDQAIRQSPRYGNSLKREILFLAIHGLLHLFGYSDYQQKDRRTMLEQQEYLLSLWEKTKNCKYKS